LGEDKQPLNTLLEQYMTIKDTRGKPILTESDAKNLIEFQRLILQAKITSSKPINFEKKFKKITKAIKHIAKKLSMPSIDSKHYKSRTKTIWLKYINLPFLFRQITVNSEKVIDQAI